LLLSKLYKISFNYIFILLNFFFTFGDYFFRTLRLFSFYTKNKNKLALIKKEVYYSTDSISISAFGPNKEDNKFYEWLAGLIDGDGYFYLSKKEIVSLEITMDLRDQDCLYLIKSKFGGSVNLRSGVKAVRYRLHQKESLIKLIQSINGLIRNPIRLNQLKPICLKYNIDLLQPKPLTYNNG
jgi:hypothetical protein